MSGCSHSKENISTISINSDSDYVKTFEELNLGILYDFDLVLHEPEQTELKVWVDMYENGKFIPEPITDLSYTFSSNEVKVGNLGVWIIENESKPLMFIYVPNANTIPQEIEPINIPGRLHAWDYAIGNKPIELALDETYLLGVYRQTDRDSIRSGYQLQNEEDVMNMIKEHSLVFLLKMQLKQSNK